MLFEIFKENRLNVSYVLKIVIVYCIYFVNYIIKKMVFIWLLLMKCKVIYLINFLMD